MEVGYMKRLISWLCIIATVLLILFYAFSAGAAEKAPVEPIVDAHANILQARNLVTNSEDGLETLVRNGTSLLSKGAAWEPLARQKLRSAAEKALQVEKLLAPYLPPSGVSALRYMNLGLGDRARLKKEYAPLTLDFLGRFAWPLLALAEGEVIGGPRPEDGRLFWLVRFSAEIEGWVPEDILSKEFPHHPVLIAAACWIQGNTITYKMVATLRMYQNDELTGERNGTVKDMVSSIIAAYECALGMYALPESIASIGATEAARYREIVKKNFPIIQEQQKQAQKKTSDSRIGPQEEGDLIRAILGNENMKGKQVVVVPIPQQEADPDRKYSPGIPTGVH